MAGKPKHKRFRGFAVAAGSQVRATKVRVCEQCDVSAQPGTKPKSCEYCGGLAFMVFDSVGECGRWHILRMLRGDNQNPVTDLRRQVRFPLYAARTVQGRVVASRVGFYVADFVYDRGGETIIEDFKGAITDLASWKLRHMEAQGMPVKLTG